MRSRSAERCARRRAFVLAAALVAATLTPAGALEVHEGESPHHHDHAGHDHGSGEPAAHDESEGLKLVASSAEDVRSGRSCPSAGPRRRYRVSAIAVDVTLNRYLDHDPEGRMYVLDGDLERVRAEERANAAARSGDGEPAVSSGLQGDAIQPLTLRVNQGDCLEIVLTNRLPAGEPASLHLHGSALRVASTGRPAVASDPEAAVAPGRSVTYEWAVAADEQEGTHYFHSHGVDRVQTGHGLFGAVIVEPRGSSWVDPLDGRPLSSGWAAVVRPPRQPAFREFALHYSEIGDETYQLRDRSGAFVPLVDPLLGAYRPGARALNYRSEPFANRMALQKSLTGRSTSRWPTPPTPSATRPHPCSGPTWVTGSSSG